MTDSLQQQHETEVMWAEKQRSRAEGRACAQLFLADEDREALDEEHTVVLLRCKGSVGSTSSALGHCAKMPPKVAAAGATKAADGGMLCDKEK